MKVLVEVLQGDFGLVDKVYSDGSKEYSLMNGGSITIERPEVVEYVEHILSGGFLGFGYVSPVEKLFKDGKITDSERASIYKILD